MTIDVLAHVHSSFSYDSPTDLADIAATARRHGIQCVLMSEHNNTLDSTKVAELVKRCAEVSSDDCLVVPGLELSLDENRTHLLAYGVREFIPSLTEPAIGPLIPRIHALGGVAVLAHPSHKGAYARVTDADLRALDGMEVWNVRNGGRYCPHHEELSAMIEMRRKGHGAAAFAGLDWHYLSHFEPLVLRISVERLAADNVLSELRAGRFSIHGRFVSFAQHEHPGLLLRVASMASTRVLIPMRRTAYRWQAKLEKRGFAAPRPLIKLARRLF